MQLKLSTLVYLINDKNQVLLIHRKNRPNQGLWSPIGGKVHVTEPESPFACAAREVFEETGARIPTEQLHLSGMVTERAYEGECHWLMFLFTVENFLEQVPAEIDEGTLEWVDWNRVLELDVPRTDREVLWPLMQKHRKGFFSVFIDCSDETSDKPFPHVVDISREG